MVQISASQLQQFGNILTGATRFSPTISNAPTTLPQQGQLIDAGLFAFNRVLANDKIRGTLFDEVRVNNAAEGSGIPIVIGPSNRVKGQWLWVSHIYPIASLPSVLELVEAFANGEFDPESAFKSYGFLGVIGFGTNILPGRSLEITALWANGEKIWVPSLLEVIEVIATDITAVNTTLGGVNVLRLEAPLGGTDLQQFIPHQFQGATVTGFTSSGNNLSNVRILREGNTSSGGSFIELEDAANTAADEAAGDTVTISQNNLVLSSILNGLAFTPDLGPRQHDPGSTTMVDATLNGIVQGTLPALLAPIVNVQLDPLLVEFGHPAYLGQLWCWFQMDLRKFNNQIPQIEAEVRENSGQTNNVRSLASAIADILEFGQLAACEYVVNDATIAPPVVGNLRGTVIETPRRVKDILAPIFEAHDLVDYEEWGKLVVINRGNERVVTIDTAKLAAHEPDGDASRRFLITDMDDQELPSSVTVGYIDVNGLLQADAQSARRHNLDNKKQASIQLPVTLSADEAKSRANGILWNAWRNRRKITLQLPPSHLYLHEQDKLKFVEGDRTYRLIVHEINEGANFLQEVVGFLEDENAAQDNLIGQSGPNQQGEPYVPPYTLMSVMDFAPLSNFHVNNPGVYHSRATLDPAAQWQGCTIWASFSGIDTIQNYGTAPFDSTAFESTMGLATTALAAPPVACSMLWDRKSTVQVKLINGSLFSQSEADILAGWSHPVGLSASGVNLARLGSEIIGFATVASNGLSADGYPLYTLSNLLRGLRNTNSATAHAVGEQFARISSTSTQYHDLAVSIYGSTLVNTWYFKAVPTAGSLYDSPTYSHTPERGLLKPFTVTGLHGVRGPAQPENTNANDLTVYWAPRMKRPTFRVFTDWYDEEDGDATKTEYYVVTARKASDNSFLRLLGTGGVVTIAGPASGYRSATYTEAQQTADGLTLGNSVKFEVQKKYGTILGNAVSVTI